MNEEEFGPWIEHDGGPCPVPVGTIVHGKYNKPGVTPEGRTVGEMIAVVTGDPRAWVREVAMAGGYTFIVRYRIKKPRGLIILEGMLEDLPAPTERVSA